MFRTTKYLHPGRIVHAVLWYIFIHLSRARRQRLKVRPYAEVLLRGFCVPFFQSRGCCSVVGCREWVKGRIGGHVDFEGRGSVAQGVICVSADHVINIANRTRAAMRFDAGPHGARGEDWRTECFMTSCVRQFAFLFYSVGGSWDAENCLCCPVWLRKHIGVNRI